MNKEKLITRTVKTKTIYAIMQNKDGNLTQVDTQTVSIGEKPTLAEGQKAIKLKDIKITYGVSIEDFMKIAHECSAEELK